MYLDDLAARIRDGVPSEELPDEDTCQLFRMYAVLLLAKGDAVTSNRFLCSQRVGWWMAGRDASHEALVPFDELSGSVQQDDEPYVEAIRRVAEFPRPLT